MGNSVANGISEFRTELLRKMPFYGDILSHLDIVENNEIETAGTNGRTIYYNRHFFEQMEPGQRNYILMHELFHVLMVHYKRQQNKDEKIWNIAADYVVNGLLDKLINEEEYNYIDFGIDFKRPPVGCFLEHYDNQSVEQLYQRIYGDNKKNRFKNMFLIVRARYSDAVKGETVRLRIKSGDMDLLSNLSEEEQNQIEKEISDLIENAEKSWSMDGSRHIIARQLNILKYERRLPWKRLLKRFLNESELEDTSFDHPERKYLHMEMILPGVSESSVINKIDDIWAFIDTSGSIGNDELNEFITQLSVICKQFDSSVNIGFWDVSMHEVYMNVTKKNLTKCITEYSGGTDVNAVYDFLDSNKITPRVMLILTDGCFDPVEDRRVKKYKNKTIVVLSQEAEANVSNMGMVAKL